MQDPRISRDMKFEDWYWWRNGGKGDGSDSYEVRPYIHDGLLYADSIGKLRYLAVNGSRSAAVFLKRYYSEGPLAIPKAHWPIRSRRTSTPATRRWPAMRRR